MPNKFAYGWRPSPPDLRDRVYQSPLRSGDPLPAKVDLSSVNREPWRTVWQQGAIGSCGPQSLAADIVYAMLVQEGFSECVLPSRLFLYFNARVLMGTVPSDSGVDNRSLLKALARYGWCDEASWPYDPAKLTVSPPGRCYEQAAFHKGGIEYLSVPQDLQSMKACLAAGDPFLLGFTVYESFESGRTQGSGIVRWPEAHERAIGGHDVLVVGYNDSDEMFKFRNSYGPEWGYQGYGYMPYEYALHKQLAGDFWTVRRSGLVKQPTPKSNATAPVSGKLFDAAGNLTHTILVTAA